MRLDQAAVEEIEALKRTVSNLADASYTLAMMGLQSDLYRTDPDYRDAVDDALAAKGGDR